MMQPLKAKLSACACDDRGMASQVVEQAEGEPLRVALWRSKAFYNYGLALEPTATSKILAAFDQANSSEMRE